MKSSNDTAVTTKGDNNSTKVSSSDAYVEKVESLTINKGNPWLWLFGLVGWILPTPRQIGESIVNFVKRIFAKIT